MPSAVPEPEVVAVVEEAARAAAPPPPAIAGQPLPLINRELSWLEFNRRVFGEAESRDVPLLERVKFLAIAANNLDEFFMIRVGALHEIGEVTPAAVTMDESQLNAVRLRSRKLLSRMYKSLGDELLPALAAAGIEIVRHEELKKKDAAQLDDYFARYVEPILTPLAVDPSHPFPYIANLALNLALLLERRDGELQAAILKIPEVLPRLVPLSDRGRYALIEDVVASRAARFFPRFKLRSTAAFRVIRNSDISIKEDDVQDLIKSVETELRRRDRRDVVWLEVEQSADESLLSLLTRSTGCAPTDVHLAPGILRLSDLRQLYDESDLPALKDPPFNPRIPMRLASADDIFSVIRSGDVLLHRPYDSFSSVIEFVEAAAEDPDVVAIKQTLYRTDTGSAVIEALATAATLGKEVTAILELQARFDEKKNISWARRLEEAGVQVVYGLVGLKTHCKICLVIRREGAELRQYVHLSTGNYNAATARIYGDIDFFTADADFGADAAQVMNLLTGFSSAGMRDLIEAEPSALPWRRLVVAPLEYHRWTLRMIERETAHAAAGKPAKITAKMNQLVDSAVIGALYRASRAGVKVELLVRGICCLVPGLPGISDNIEVTSVIDRFLEHARVFRFENGGAPEIYLSSGDWMPRNFFRRVEVTWPVTAPALVRRIEEQILPIGLADNVKSWILRSDGKYERRTTAGTPVRSQESFINIARAEAVPLGSYDEVIRRPFGRKWKKRKKK